MDRISGFVVVLIALFSSFGLEALPQNKIPPAQETKHANGAIATSQIELEAQARALEVLLEESSKSGSPLAQSNDLAQINLDYENTNTDEGNKADNDNPIPIRTRRTLGTFYCSIFFSSNPTECPLRRSRMVEMLFPNFSQTMAQLTRMITTPQKSENDLWPTYSYAKNNDTGSVENTSSSIQLPVIQAPVNQRPTVFSGLRAIFPRTFKAFTQGYRSGSGTGGTYVVPSPSTYPLEPNQNTRFPILSAMNPLRRIRNFFNRMTDTAQKQNQ